MTMTVNTTEYQFSHGRKPRGQGTWAFQFSNGSVVFSSPYQTYTQALRDARKLAFHEGTSVAKVLP